MVSMQPDGAELLRRVAAGDPSAVRECVDTFGGLVWGLARRWARVPADAEDLVQEVFFDLWRSAARFDPARASARGFVAMIARRRFIDHARRRGRMPDLVPLPDDFDAPGDPGDEPERRLDLDSARELLARLTPEQRRMLELALVDGKTHDEIARETGVPLGTVKSHIRRGLQQARRLAGAATGAVRPGRTG